ncbi:MAG: hypothetical protein GY820_10190 [Gammaproteobacteria bacterium]|nr:hypothetical protein [Gammaproteobacteria bacterium]
MSKVTSLRALSNALVEQALESANQSISVFISLNQELASQAAAIDCARARGDKVTTLACYPSAKPIKPGFRSLSFSVPGILRSHTRPEAMGIARLET